MSALRSIADFAAWSWRLWALTWALAVALASTALPVLTALLQGTACVLAMFAIGSLYALVVWRYM
jgi:hypothetical protein